MKEREAWEYKESMIDIVLLKFKNYGVFTRESLRELSTDEITTIACFQEDWEHTGGDQDDLKY